MNATATFMLLLAVIASSIGIVYAQHQNRKLFVELQALSNERDAMETEWGQLQLEQSTLTTQGQVENAARKRLGMITPEPGKMVIIRP